MFECISDFQEGPSRWINGWNRQAKSAKKAFSGGFPTKSMHYAELVVHKKAIAYCVKTQGGKILDQGEIRANGTALAAWTDQLKRPWLGAIEATLFTGWIYDFLKPHARELKVAHLEMLKAITASKKRNGPVDACKIADLVQCDLLPECYMAPSETRDRSRVLRYRNLIVSEATQMKNKISGLLMEVGAQYSKQKLHGKRYFGQMLAGLKETPPSVIKLLKLSSSNLELFDGLQK